MDLNGTSVLVTGATGFVGPYLVQALIEEGAQVKILSLREAGIPSNLFADDLEIVIGDITKPEMLDGITKGIDLVFHLAAIANVDYAIKNPVKTYDVNVRGTLNILEEVRKNPIKKLVYVSSSQVYGVPQYMPVDEMHPIAPREPYSASKAAAENIVNGYAGAYGIDTAIVRPFNIYGPGQDDSFLIPSIIKQASCNDLIEVGNVEPTRDFTYITDVVNGFLAIAESGLGVYNLGSGIEMKVGDILKRIVDIVNPDIEVRSVIDRQRSGGVEIARLCANVSRLKELGWAPTIGIDDGLNIIAKCSGKDRT
ncbi:NAD-dependent epimerase/dehydratase family protein [Methanococcoides methylutens]|uniref:NAD-dependent epimerase/dehydratase family protein n=1 Tax=Methanococcoides methylutens TaxID=2226 RepID=UPI004043E9C5